MDIRRYTIEIDVRDFQSLEHYQMGLEDEPNEVHDIVRDVLWQIVQAEKDRIADFTDLEDFPANTSQQWEDISEGRKYGN